MNLRVGGERCGLRTGAVALLAMAWCLDGGVMWLA